MLNNKTLIQRILISRLRFIGDVILTTPVIKALKKHYPRASIHYLAEKVPGSVLANNPYLDEVIVLPQELLPSKAIITRFSEHVRFLKNLRQRQFDLVIDFLGNPRSAFLTLATGAPYRIGYDLRVRGKAYNIKIKRSDSPRALDAYLDALHTLGIPIDDKRTKVYFSGKDMEWAQKLLEGILPQNPGPLIALNLGASWPAKTWSMSKFSELARQLIKRFNSTILLVVGPGQQKKIANFNFMFDQPCPIVETNSLTRLAAVISHCNMYISNDCGPMHLAAAVGTPTIGIFGPSSPDIWFPYQEENGCVGLRNETENCCGRDFCSRSLPCINLISPQVVFKTVEALLRKFNYL